MPILNSVFPRCGLIELSFDDRSRLSIRKDDFAALPLTVGQEVDLESYQGRVCARQLAAAYEAALSLLDYCARTESEIRKKLSLKGYLPPVLDAVVERLKMARLVDDSEYAHHMLESPGARQKGVFALKRKLRAKGISENDADEALSVISDEEQADAALTAARTLARKYQALDPRAFRAKMSQALARRGFSWDAISHALAALGSEDDD